MGQKVNPIGLRLGINRTWDSRWYANTGEYGRLLHEDLKIREMLEKELKQAAVPQPLRDHRQVAPCVARHAHGVHCARLPSAPAVRREDRARLLGHPLRWHLREGGQPVSPDDTQEEGTHRRVILVIRQLAAHGIDPAKFVRRGIHCRAAHHLPMVARLQRVTKPPIQDQEEHRGAGRKEAREERRETEGKRVRKTPTHVGEIPNAKRPNPK